MDWHLFAAFAAIATAVGSALVVLFTGGRFVGRVERVWEEMRTAMQEWKEDRKKLTTIDLQGQRIEQLEEVAKGQSRKLDQVWLKVFSHDRHLAVVRDRMSSHSEIHDTDPPHPGDDE